MKTRILAIFTCHNRKEKTLKCLKSLTEGNPEMDLHFVAVDDGSTDGTAEALEGIDQVIVVHGSGSLYYTGGMREGMKCARKQEAAYDYVLLFNDDVEFYEKAIQRMADAIPDDGHTVLVGITCGSDGQLSYGGVKKKSGFRPSFQIVMSGAEKIYCDTFNANCVLIPWEIFQTAPIMDSHYRHSLGDFDYGLTLKNMGYVIEAADFFAGECNDNPPDGTWRDPGLPRKKRIQMKESPKGLPAGEWFHFVRTYFGMVSACVYTVLPYLKIILGRPT